MTASRVVLYDGGCGLCSRTVRLLTRLDVLARLRFTDLDADWARVSLEHPSLDHESCLREMHVITAGGQILAGFDACRSLAWAVPLGWVTLPFLYIPGVPQIGRRLYRAVAAHRVTTSCTLPT